MTTARLFYDGDWICAFDVRGHSGYAREGEDIVCAAVSAVAQATLIGLVEVLNLPVKHESDEKRGVLSVKIRSAGRESQILLDTMKRALEAIANDYPDYLQVIRGNGGNIA